MMKRFNKKDGYGIGSTVKPAVNHFHYTTPTHVRSRRERIKHSVLYALQLLLYVFVGWIMLCGLGAIMGL